jgi:hypothetical protein
MADPAPANSEMLAGFGVAGYALAIETLHLLARKRIITPREGAGIIEAALSSIEKKQRQNPAEALEAACELLAIHQVMWQSPSR